jgi:recombinational DNA repair ATPase RecF
MDNELTVNLADGSPRRLLVGWANKQDAWLRALVAETILSRQEVSDEALDRICGMFLAEKGMSTEPSPVVPYIEMDDAETVAEESLELKAITKVVGVNALAAEQSLDFDPSLTILFGQNGSGKTGYARILKRLSAVRIPEDILPNAHAAVGADQAIPSASIAFELAGEAREVLWRNEAGLSPFTRISVFDSSAVSLHVDSELGYVYTPAELALFSHVSAGIQRLQQRLATQISELRPGINSLLTHFARGSKVYPVIETLGATTELADLEELAKVPDGAEAMQEQLQGEVSALRGNTFDALVANARQVERDLSRLHGVLNTVRAFDANVYEKAQQALEAAETRRREAREQLFSEHELAGPPDEDWQRFVVAGDEYRRHLGLEQYPEAEDQCLYCRHPLSDSALDLVGRYRTFLDETLVQQVTTAQRNVDDVRLILDGSALQQATEYVEAQLKHDPAPEWATSLRDLLSDATTVGGETVARKKITHADLTTRVNPHVATIGSALTAATTTATELATQQANSGAILSTKQQELLELTARIELKRHLAAARSFVQRAKQAARLDQLSKDISKGALKQLTEQSKLASEDLVNRDFETLFDEECGRLRAPKVALRFQGRSGKAERKKVVANYRPSAVLSEGEQKVLAIADFLAESRMRGTKAPLVFDDPVTSLDYRRLDEVASRIQQLAETHQVIVLTHNVMFASALIATRQNKKLRAKVYEVRDGGDSKGILAPDVEPRFDTAADIAKRINTKLQEIPKADPVLQDALIKESYDLLRAWCEAFVEQELLQSVTQRYRANVMMSKLDKIRADRIDAAVAVIAPLFDRACTRMAGHSQAAEYLNIKPTVSELQEDWDKAKAARTAYLAD